MKINEQDDELEQFIRDWHYDKKSHILAQQLGKLFFEFIDSLEDAELSRPTVLRHLDNCWAIGFLMIQYGYYKDFPSMMNSLEDGQPCYEYEYQRKFWDSDYAKKSYASTWRKIAKFLNSQKR
jgi:hypothetical protein